MWRRAISTGLTLAAVTLVLAACGPTGGTGGGATPTPTATSIPACTAWKIIPSPAATQYARSHLAGVSALSPTDAWAVGNYTASDHTIRTLIAHWNGTAWTVASSPDEWGELAGVAAIGARDVRAVGYHMTGAEGSAPIGIVEQWNGATWSLTESPTPQGVTHSSLDAVATDGAGGYWAVGAYPNADGISQAFIARCG